MSELLRPFRAVFWPLLLTVLSLALLPEVSRLTGPWQPLFPWLPAFLGLPLVLLTWHFNHSRGLLACLIAALCYGVGRWLPQDGLLIQGTLLIAPLNLMILSFYRERGILNGHGLQRLALIGLQATALFWVARQEPHLLQELLHPFQADLPWLHLPATALATMLGATLVLLIRLMRTGEAVNGYLLLTLGLMLWPLARPLGADEHHLTISLVFILWLLALLQRSHEMAYRDELTGLPGRRALNEARLRLGKRHSIAMLDVDHFKAFNDRYGHDVGDQVLKLVASRLAGVSHGRAFRYGGEEFCILFPGKNTKQVLEPLEEVRRAVAEAQLQLRSAQRPKDARQGRKKRGKPRGAGRSVAVTISIGVAENIGQDTLKQADQALYRAKKQGRNRVCF